MRVAVYARVSTTRQAQAQGIEQQLDRLRAAAAERGWDLDDQHVYRDDGYSGARIGRPGLDRLRDHAALADLDVVLVTAPDRLARNYVHQVLLCEELAGHGGRARCCRGRRRRSGTGWTPGGPATRRRYGWSPGRRRWSPSCSTGTSNPGRPSTGSRRG